ncbi:MAG: serine hydrolase [bacterium]|nr:serine hydrolase [bacterium]
MVFLTVCLIVFPSIFGQGPVPSSPAGQEIQAKAPSATQPPASPELSATDVEAFLDGILPQQIKRDNIAGATVSIVKDGRLLFAKGYGYADVANKRPVSAEETLFRPGSISKLFTWTAVMQLHEQGKLDLDKDVNEYLDFKLPDAFGEPITLKHILTHTPGFEEQIKDLFVVDSTPPNLGEYVKTHIPGRIYPPGKVPAYSNYATALAGYIVERVSGRPFNDYLDENIFRPLGMDRSTFAQPLPANLAENMSNGYRLATGDPVPFEMVTAFPAGSLSSTAWDMSKFMLAHLQGGELNGQRILNPETAQLMHTRLFALDDAARGMAHGFYEENQNGLRIIGHGGDTIAFHSDLHLLLDKGVGFFVSYNSAGKGEVSNRTMLWDAFISRYYPHTGTEKVVPNAKEEAQKAAGLYILSRRSEKSFLRIASILSEAAVGVNADDTISVSLLTGANGAPIKWKAVGPGKFRDVDGEDLLIFKPDDAGNMQMIISKYPFMVGQRVGVFENSTILLPVLGLSLGIMLLTLLIAPIAWLVRRHYGHKLELERTSKWLRLGVWIVFAIDLVFVVSLVGLTMYGLSNIEVFSDSGTKWFQLIQSVGIIGAIGTVVVLYNAVYAWMNKPRTIWGKLQATMFALACVGFLWFAFVGNLLRITSNY